MVPSAYMRVAPPGTMDGMRTRTRDTVLTTVLLVLAWGSTFAAIKIGLRTCPPLVFSALRSGIAAVVLSGCALRWGGRPQLRTRWREYAVLTVLNVVLFYAAQALAVERLPTGMAAVLIYLQPILVGVLAWRFLGEPLGVAKLVGLVLGFAGIVAVSAGAISGSLPALGIVFAVVTAASWAAGTILLKSWSALDPWWAIAVPFALGTPVLAVLGGALEGWHVGWGGGFVPALLYVGLIGTALAWVLWTRLLTRGEASRAATYIFFVPLVSLLIGGAFLGESLGLTLLLGALLVGTGVYLANRPVPVSAPARPRVRG